MRRVLVIHEDEGQRLRLTSVLSRVGFHVVAAQDTDDGLRQLHKLRPDLVIASASFGPELCARISQTEHPLIVVGEVSETKGIMMLENGADAYLPARVSDNLLIAWIHSLLRRYKQKPPNPRLDPDSRQIQLGSTTTQLSPTEFRLFSRLSSNQGQVIPYPCLIGDVWGGTAKLDTLHYYTRRLKQKLGIESAGPYRLLNYRGEGYCFVAEKQA